MGNRLLVFSVQLCFVLHKERHYFSIENPLGSWTWAVAAVATPRHARSGDSTGVLRPVWDTLLQAYPFPRQPPLVAQVVGASARDPRRGDRLARSVLVQGRVEVQDLASVTVPASCTCVPCYGRPFPAVGPMAPLEGHACYIEGADLLAGNMFISDHVRSAVARAHFTCADDNDDSEGDNLVPYELGSKRGWLPSDHVRWALVQPHPFKNQEAKLDLKLQLAVKESAALKPKDLDKLRTERLQYWTLRALQLEEERARWVTEAPPQLQRMLTSVHGLLVLELCARCSHDLYLASDLQKGLPFVDVLPRSLDFCQTGGEQVCDLSVAELRAQRAERNTYVMSRVVPSEWSLDLWESTVAGRTSRLHDSTSTCPSS